MPLVDKINDVFKCFQSVLYDCHPFITCHVIISYFSSMTSHQFPVNSVCLDCPVELVDGLNELPLIVTSSSH